MKYGVTSTTHTAIPLSDNHTTTLLHSAACARLRQLDALYFEPPPCVRPALQHHGGRLVELHHAAQHGAEDGLVTLVIDTLLQRHVDRVVPPGTRAWEINL